MPLTAHARRTLRHGLRDDAAGNEVADVIDAGSGTLSVQAQRRVEFAMTNSALAAAFVTAVDAGSAISGAVQNRLGFMLSSRPVAQEIADELSS